MVAAVTMTMHPAAHGYIHSTLQVLMMTTTNMMTMVVVVMMMHPAAHLCDGIHSGLKLGRGQQQQVTLLCSYACKHLHIHVQLRAQCQQALYHCR